MKSKKCIGCKTMIGPNTERMYNHLGTFCDYRCLDTYKANLSQGDNKKYYEKNKNTTSKIHSECI